MVRIIFYDFDNTLSLSKLPPTFKEQHDVAVKSILQRQGEHDAAVKTLLQRQGKNGILRVVVSTSVLLQRDMAASELSSYVDETYSVREPFDKIATILTILDCRKISVDDALYFDDDDDCVKEAMKHGIHGICVSQRRGILPHVSGIMETGSRLVRKRNDLQYRGTNSIKLVQNTREIIHENSAQDSE